MEIRFRKLLRGAMALEVWNYTKKKWEDADHTIAEIVKAAVNDGGLKQLAAKNCETEALKAEIETLRSQLSEALNKLREYREAEERVEDERKSPAAFKALALVEMLKSFADRASRESEFFKRTGAGTKYVGARTDGELRPLKDRLIEAGCVGPIAAKIATAYDRNPPWGTKAEQGLIQIVRKGQFSREDFLMLLEDAPWLFQNIRATRDAFQGMGDHSQPIDRLVTQMWEPDDEAKPVPDYAFATGGYVASSPLKDGEVPAILTSGYIVPTTAQD